MSIETWGNPTRNPITKGRHHAISQFTGRATKLTPHAPVTPNRTPIPTSTMAIQVGACRVCAEETNTYLANHKSIYAYDTVLGPKGKATFTINIAGDPRTADYKSLFAQAWEKCKELKFPYHATKQDRNIIYCSNYQLPTAETKK